MPKAENCHLCGKKGVHLTKDHIQPQCAFNERTRRYVRLMSDVELRKLQRPAPHGRRFRDVYYELQPDKPIGGGIYRYTQCAECNSFLGAKYDARLGEFCRDAVSNMKLGRILIVRKTYPQIIRYPLAVLKRVLAMFFSINGSQFVYKNAELSHFILNPENRTLPQQYRLFVGYNANDLVSHIPYQLRVSLGKRGHRAMSQIAHPPFVYLLTFNTGRPDNRLVEFSGFTDFDYDQEANVKCNFQILPTNNFFAGDFRRAGKVIPDPDAIFTTDLKASYFRLADAII